MEKIIVAHAIDIRAAAVTQTLVRHGYDTRLVHDGDSLIELAESWTPDGAVIELSLEKRPALQVGSELRSRYSDAIRLVGFTVPRATELEQKALRAGFDQVLVDAHDAAEILLALSGAGGMLVRRAQGAAFAFANTLLEGALVRLRNHSQFRDPAERRHNLHLLLKTVAALGRLLESGTLDEDRRHYVRFQLAGITRQVEDLPREE